LTKWCEKRGDARRDTRKQPKGTEKKQAKSNDEGVKSHHANMAFVGGDGIKRKKGWTNRFFKSRVGRGVGSLALGGGEQTRGKNNQVSVQMLTFFRGL